MEEPSATRISIVLGRDDDGSGAEVARAVAEAAHAEPGPVSIHIELEIEEQRMGARKKRIGTEKTEAKNGPEWTEDDIVALINEVYSRDYVYGGRIVGGTATIVRDTARVEAVDLPMQRVGTRTYFAVSEADEWDTRSGTCVFDFIESRYKSTRAARRSKLVDIFSSKCDDPVARGVTTKAVAEFARRAKVRMIAAGPDGRVIYRSTQGSERKPVLAYAVANGHMFPVLDPVEVAYMARFGFLRHRRPERGAGPRAARAPIVDESAACDFVSVAHAPHIVVPVADLTAVWTRAMLVARRTFPAATTHGTFRIVRFRANGVTVYANEEYAELRALAGRLAVRCAPSDGIGTLARRFFESRVPRLARLGLAGIPKKLRVGEPRAALLGACAEYTSSARCFDVRGCYAAALRDNGGLEWTVPGPFDELEPYDEAPLGPGRYFVREPFGPATPLVKGDGWYYERYARWRVERGASVVAQQRARCSLHCTTFTEAVDECRARLGTEAKRVINAFIGTTFPRQSLRGRGRCTATTELAEARVVSPEVREQDGTALAFRTYGAVAQPDVSFLYEQIVEGGWVSVDELREFVGGTLVAVKTDAVVVDFPDGEGPAASCFGAGSKWREEPVGARVTVPLPRPTRTEAPVLGPRAWTQVPESGASAGGSVLITGAAGTGKSRLARGIAEAYKKRVARVAPTNKAAASIKGTTIHALFGITNPEAFCDPPDFRAMRRVENAYDYILVDEVFMCTEWMFGAMLALKKMRELRALEAEKSEKSEEKVKELTFILCGDPYQLPPVGDDLDPLVVRDSSCVYELCSGRRVDLTVPRRSAGDPWLFSACAELIAAPPSRASNAAFVARFCPSGPEGPSTSTGPSGLEGLEGPSGPSASTGLEGPSGPSAPTRLEGPKSTTETKQKEPNEQRALSFLNATAAKFNRAQATRARRGWRWLVYEPDEADEPDEPDEADGPEGPRGPSNGCVLRYMWDLRRVSARARVFPLRAPLVALSSAFVPRGTIARLKRIDESTVVVEHGARELKSVPRTEFSAAFDLAYCVTIHRAQCETIDEPYVVLDSRRIVALEPAYARALLYVAASRATRASFVRFGP